METIWSNKVDEILKEGIFLGSIGVRNWALPNYKALDALSKLEAVGIAILGGDVLEMSRTGDIGYNYDNWHCEIIIGETKENFAKRTVIRAKEYINNYRSKGSEVFFAFVPDVG